MKAHFHSTNNSQYQSITSKSSNSSIISILREPSPDRKKKKNTVRFDDSSLVSTYSDAAKPDPSSPSQFSSKSPSPSYYKPLSQSPARQQEPKLFSPGKKSPVKKLSTPEPNLEEEKKATPKVINYSFRNKGFYDKLNKFYTTESSPAKEPDRIYIKLDPKSFMEKVSPENQVIHLRPCSSKPYARSKDNRIQALKRNRGQNILN